MSEHSENYLIDLQQQSKEDWISFLLRKRNLLCTTLVLGLSCVILPLSLGSEIWLFPRFGGLIGSLCSLIILVTYILVPRARKHPSPLLFYRAVADFLLGLRMVLDPIWTNYYCNSISHCTISQVSDADCEVCTRFSFYFSLLDFVLLFCCFVYLFAC